MIGLIVYEIIEDEKPEKLYLTHFGAHQNIKAHFDELRKNLTSKKNKKRKITVNIFKNDNSCDINEINNLCESIILTKDLVNTPFSHLKATDLAELAKEAGNKSGFTTTIFNKKKIQSLKMGGLVDGFPNILKSELSINAASFMPLINGKLLFSL